MKRTDPWLPNSRPVTRIRGFKTHEGGVFAGMAEVYMVSVNCYLRQTELSLTMDIASFSSRQNRRGDSTYSVLGMHVKIR